ncbi:MAG TPA: Xaa-Pro peptidase family protein [Gemmatimonadales bacterium]|nr:Xaa-Pro peptidase family protein [Gemmatimonadales bacterium]
MMRDAERIGRIVDGLRDAGLDALVVAHPSNVLLASGYWPVLGTAIAIVNRDGAVGVLAPEDERELADRGWADDLRTVSPGSLDALTPLDDVVRAPLGAMLERLGVARGRVGYERGPLLEPSSYAGVNRYGAALPDLIAHAAPAARLAGGDALLHRLRAVLTRREIDCVRHACRIAGEAYCAGTRAIQVGAAEREVAAAFRAALAAASSAGASSVAAPATAASSGGATSAGATSAGATSADVAPVGADETDVRAGGFFFCMSGPDAAHAGRAYARSSDRPLAGGDLVLVHCNTCLGGYWTDITRTFILRPAHDRARELHEAVLAARGAALDALVPGARAADVDGAARAVLARHGLAHAFTHGTGHGVGFAAIDGNARPRLHPASPDVLEAGMVMNVEPAAYLAGFGGVRHCDVVALGATGAELLTPFQSDAGELRLEGRA